MHPNGAEATCACHSNQLGLLAPHLSQHPPLEIAMECMQQLLSASPHPRLSCLWSANGLASRPCETLLSHPSEPFSFANCLSTAMKSFAWLFWRAMRRCTPYMPPCWHRYPKAAARATVQTKMRATAPNWNGGPSCERIPVHLHCSCGRYRGEMS